MQQTATESADPRTSGTGRAPEKPPRSVKQVTTQTGGATGGGGGRHRLNRRVSPPPPPPTVPAPRIAAAR